MDAACRIEEAVAVSDYDVQVRVVYKFAAPRLLKERYLSYIHVTALKRKKKKKSLSFSSSVTAVSDYFTR
jgi:hypothetical protein